MEMNPGSSFHPQCRENAQLHASCSDGDGDGETGPRPASSSPVHRPPAEVTEVTLLVTLGALLRGCLYILPAAKKP